MFPREAGVELPPEGVRPEAYGPVLPLEPGKEGLGLPVPGRVALYVRGMEHRSLVPPRVEGLGEGEHAGGEVHQGHIALAHTPPHDMPQQAEIQVCGQAQGVDKPGLQQVHGKPVPLYGLVFPQIEEGLGPPVVLVLVLTMAPPLMRRAVE